MRAMEPGEPEPDIGTLIFDSFGVAWQKLRRAGDGEKWFEPGMHSGVSWGTLQTLGPLAEMAVVVGGHTAERWPPLNDDGFLPGDVDLIGDNPWST